MEKTMVPIDFIRLHGRNLVFRWEYADPSRQVTSAHVEGLYDDDGTLLFDEEALTAMYGVSFMSRLVAIATTNGIGK